MPILTDVSPAQEAVIKMNLCKCKTGFNTMQCKCKKNSLVCTEMCPCTGCKSVTVNKDLKRPIVHNDGGENNGM